jgi:hypothetical protein
VALRGSPAALGSIAAGADSHSASAPGHPRHSGAPEREHNGACRAAFASVARDDTHARPRRVGARPQHAHPDRDSRDDAGDDAGDDARPLIDRARSHEDGPGARQLLDGAGSHEDSDHDDSDHARPLVERAGSHEDDDDRGAAG